MHIHADKIGEWENNQDRKQFNPFQLLLSLSLTCKYQAFLAHDMLVAGINPKRVFTAVTGAIHTPLGGWGGAHKDLGNCDVQKCAKMHKTLDYK